MTLFGTYFDKKRCARVLTLLLTDAILVNAAAFLALLTRFEFRFSDMVASGFPDAYMSIAVWQTLASLVLFSLTRLYRSLWEYASFEETGNLLLAALGSSVSLIVISYLLNVYLPRSMPLLYLVFIFLFVGGLRYSYRVARRIRQRSEGEKRRTMVIGGGEAGAIVVRELQRSGVSRNRVVCIIDDDPRKHGAYLMGVKIVGGRELIEEYAESCQIDDIVLAIPSATYREKREIVELCQRTKCSIRTLPGIYQLASGQISVDTIRNVSVEDLLGRDKVQVDLPEICSRFSGKTVLVTGGGGSIGSELCRQIARNRPGQLIIFDIYENSAYEIQQELRHTHPELDLVVLIGSVRDQSRVQEVFERYRPDIVCHAAAHKHVPLMEDSPNEAIKNNVFGTYHVAQAADAYGADTFVLISTDKAVNPTNIMGASKRVCEMIVQVMGQHSKTKFTAVRFGNVLGSNGSVIPLFKKQIERGGPVTVTHRDIIRYFMTISEAVSLVLQACVYARGGEVFVLDMGDPVRIDDLARNMIRLSGMEPDVDIEVVYTGLRPGEKLYEELLMQSEGLDKTPNELIFIGHFRDFDEEQVIHALGELSEACRQGDGDIRDLVQKLVRTYHPAENGVK